MPPYKYAHLTDELRTRIRSGALAPGDRLPSEDKLMSEHPGMARMSARRVIDPLVSEGLAHRIHGSGTYAGPGEDVTLTVTLPRDVFVALDEQAGERDVHALAAEYLTERARSHDDD